MSKTAVIVATYQRPEMLKKCLSGVDFGDVVLVYNNIEDIAGSEEKAIKTIHTTYKGAGVKSFGGDWACANRYENLIFLDDDCIPEVGAIQKICAKLYNSTGVAGGGSRWSTYKSPNIYGIFEDLTHTGDFWGTTAEFWKSAGGMDPNMMVSEDYDFQLRLRIMGYHINAYADIGFDYEPEAEGGLTESGMWRGSDRNKNGRMYAIKRMGYKYPGLLRLDVSFQEFPEIIQYYSTLYQQGKIVFDREAGIVWK